VTIKAKWDKLRFWNLSTYLWVFVEGKMFAIHEATHDRSVYDQVKQDKINNKTFYAGTTIKREKLKKQL
jgi:hypothetical protein